MRTILSVARLLLAFSITLVLSPLTRAEIVAYGIGQAAGGFAEFNAAAGNPPIAIDFDTIASGTDITGTTIQGVQFLGPNAPLIVVRGIDTITPAGFSGAPDPASNKLLPTSGLNVLSPGGLVLGPGPDNAVEDDDLTLEFATPVVAFGFDHLSQSADGFSGTNVQVFNQVNALLYSGTIPVSGPGGGAPGGADFWGIVGINGDLIRRVVIDEGDANNQP